MISLSCLFGHSWSEKTEKSLIVIRDFRHDRWRFSNFKTITQYCNVCSKYKFTSKTLRSESDNSIGFTKGLKDTLIDLRTEDEKSIKEFINLYNFINKTGVKIEDFEHV